MSTLRDQIKQAIFGQESTSGAADTSQPNSSGARGPMQVTEPTFNGMQKLGIVPADWSWANPVHSKEAGNRLIDHLADKYSDDPGRIAAAYYGGEKAVNADGSINNYHDLKNPGNPTVMQYASQIMKRLGLAYDSGDGTDNTGGVVSTTKEPIPSAADLNVPMRALPPRKPGMGQLMAAAPLPVPDPYNAPPADGTALLGAATAEGDKARTIEQRRLDTSLLDSAQAGYMHQGISGIILRGIASDVSQYPATPGYDPRVNSTALYEGKTEEEQEVLDQAKSHDQAQYLNYGIENRREDMDTVAAGGPTQALISQLVGGVPEGYITGLGAAKAAWIGAKIAGMGPVTSLAGKLAMNVGENIVGNVGSVAAQQALDPYVTSADYPMAFGMSVLGSALHGLGSASEFMADRAQLHDTANRLGESGADRTVQLRQEAMAHLGGDAEPADIAKEMNRLDVTSTQRDLVAAQGELPRERTIPGREVFEQSSDGDVAAAKEIVSTDKGEAPKGWDQVDTSVPNAAPENFPSQLPRWDKGEGLYGEASRRAMMEQSPEWRDQFSRMTEGLSLKDVDALPNGVHVQDGLLSQGKYSPAIRAIESLAKQFLPDAKIVLGRLPEDVKSSMGTTTNGQVISVGKVHAIGLATHLSPGDAITTAIHELGHAIFHQTAKDIPTDLLALMQKEHQSFIDDLHAGKPTARYKRFAEGGRNAVSDHGTLHATPLRINAYMASFDEYTAEAFVRHIQKAIHDDGMGIEIPKGVVAHLMAAWEKVKSMYEAAFKRGLLPKDEAFSDYFQRVLDDDLKAQQSIPVPEHGTLSDEEAMASFHMEDDPIAKKYGFDLIPQSTPGETARAVAIRAMYSKAEDPKAPWNNLDEKRLKVLTDNKLFNVASTDVTMLKAKNPLVRMIATELLEDPTGASGRRSTAAMAKYLNESKYLGNTTNEYRSAYTRWRGMNGGSLIGDTFNGDHWRRFNLAVAEEMEGRRVGIQSPAFNEHVTVAANALEQAYERIRVAQVDAKTIGWGALPENSKGYMPHRMSPEKIRNMTNEQGRVLHSAMVDQFVSGSGFDITFAAELASKYIERIRTRGLGGFESPINVYHTGAADIVEDALKQMGMSNAEIHAQMQQYASGGASHTKTRLDLNLLAEHDDGTGTPFRLIDMFETDQEKLLRSQAGRVSGEVALARHGIMGRPGLGLIRQAMEFGEDGAKATNEQMEAFDQISSEFLSAPVGKGTSIGMQRVIMANSLARLGGMGFTQAAEYINAAAHIGVVRTLQAVAGFGRLRKEAIALSKGEHVDNPILGSIEVAGGREFGAEAYKMNFPFATESTQYGSFGRDTPGFADKLLRGGVNLQAKLSFWRAIHAAQQRGLAEQSVLKAADYIRNGGDHVALSDMGITPEVAARMKADIDEIAPLGADGKIASFDITKARDLHAAEDFVQAIHRGVGQMIQQSFIGETGKWAHNDLLKLLTQFRTFSIISVEKQWARQVGNRGTGAALGILMGSMAAAAPIYIVRTYTASIGRSDQQAYLERQLSPQMIARATMNYVALSGLAGDFMDSLTTVSGIGGGGTGGRASAGTDFFGNTVAPSIGLVNDMYKGIQNTKNGTDPSALLKTLPFGRLPFLIPAIEGLSTQH